MNCPKCGYEKNDVMDSRPGEGVIRRRRKCRGCGYKWNTVEMADPGEEFFTNAITYSSRVKEAKAHLTAALEILRGKE